MSSFSSVVRKGPNPKPRVAPRRTIVRKAPAPHYEEPAHVGLGTSALPLPPSPPATGEDADTQPSLSTRESTVPQTRHDAPEAPNQESPIATESTHATSTSHEPINDVQNDTPVPVVTSTQDTFTNNGPQTFNKHQARVVSSEEGVSTRQASSDSQQFTTGRNDDNNQSPERRALTSNSNGVVQTAQAVSEEIPSSRRGPTSPAQSRQGRKRKQPPRASANIILSQPSVPDPTTSSLTPSVNTTRSQAPRQASRTSSISSQQSNTRLSAPENEFDRISSQLQIVQDASAAINARTLSVNTTAQSTVPTVTTSSLTTAGDSVEQPSIARPIKKRRINRTRRRTAEEQAADVIANVMGGAMDSTEPVQKRARGATPEDAEMHEITPQTTKMGDLCDDHKWGKKSETEKEMAANWDEILRRRKEDAEERMALAAAGSRRRREKGQHTDSNSEPTVAVVPVMAIENGVIVTASRQIDRHAQTMANAEQTNEADIREDKDIYKRVLATTVGCRNPQTQGQVWDDLATELFYNGLKKFGTDFQMISATIPGKTRKQVKLKYNVEERKNWPRVKKCLSMKEEVNLEEYAEATGVQFASVADVYKQMEEDEKRLREEDEQRRRDEGIISQDPGGDAAAAADGDASGEADVAIPSIETGAEAAAREIVEAAIGTDRQSTASRVGSTTTARQTAQPSGKRKQTGKKSTAASKKGRQAAGKNKGFEGVEERIGGIEEMAMSGA